MKRSDLVKNLSEFLQSEVTGYESANHHITDADKILAFIEKEGMLPPIESSAKQYKTLCNWELE